MAPEQFDGEVLSPAVDVYAVGVMLAEMLTGAAPFEARSIVELCLKKREICDGVELAPEAASEATRVLVRRMTVASAAQRTSASQALAEVERLVPATSVLAPTNLDFRFVGDDGRPVGWLDGREHVAGVSAAYRVTVQADSGAVILESPPDADEAFGSLMQRVPAAHMVGRRVRFSALVSTRSVARCASLWLRVDDAQGRTLLFDNMHGRGLTGSAEWTELSVEAVVPSGARWFNYGLLLVGGGAAAMTRVEVTAVGERGAETSLNMGPGAAARG